MAALRARTHPRERINRRRRGRKNPEDMVSLNWAWKPPKSVFCLEATHEIRGTRNQDAERCTQKMMCFAQRRNQPSHWSRLAKTVSIEAMQLRKTMYDKTEFNEWIHDRNEGATRSSSMKKSRTWRNPMMIEHG